MFSDTSVKASAENAFENVKLIATVDERSRDKLFDWNVNESRFRISGLFVRVKKKRKGKIGRPRTRFLPIFKISNHCPISF